MSDWLTNDVAVVTGGASGIGREISLLLAEHGADVVIADLQSEPRSGGTATHEKIGDEHGQQSEFVECDVTNNDDLERTVDAAEELGGISIMVNNAGMSQSDDFLETTEAEFQQIMDVNVKGPFFGSQLAAKRMIDADRDGRIVNVASISGITGRGTGVRYCTSKGAVRLMTYALASALGPRGIRTNAVCPGVIDTGMTRDDLGFFESDAANEYREQSPLQRVGVPEDIAGAVLYLVSPLASYVNGESLVVDGGATNTWGGVADE